ncbi:hypothetical protein CTI14_58885, partial [Methylobacterium radiotolerans]
MTFTLKDASNNTVAGTTSFNSGNTVVTFTPFVNPRLQRHVHGHRERSYELDGSDHVEPVL